MKTMKWIFPAAVIALSLSSCNKKWFGIKGKGSNVTEVRSVSGFHEIDLSIDADVTFVQDSVYSIEISAQSNVLAVLETEVSEGELEIDFSKNVRKHNKITIIIHAPSLNGINVDGSGSVVVQNSLTTGSLELEISGSGNVTIPSLTAQSLDASISGSGNMNILGGTVTSQVCEISGSGNMNSLSCVSTSTSASISGSGTISVNVTTSLNASISGSGDIKYTGNPVVNSNISGSGSIIHL